MPHRKIIRAWKDEDYRLSLSEAERAVLPGHPAGLVELPDADRALPWERFRSSVCCTLWAVMSNPGANREFFPRLRDNRRVCGYESRLLQRS